ncbi:hypothetical protein UFOVP450_199 [uncultured Caudovirales phage]|uniref:Glycine-rich domain-containing protein n=1 Tax=uncultured Caudovirales phage TaxID=2100421 RepID=A0A6J5MF56_9CAUD|nr:hypothetical protein UFOVP450_199 [uncultured Caudovirales phage]
MYGSSRDYGFLPPQFTGDVQMFNSMGTANTQYQTWNKPAGATMVYMWCVGGGGGGGGGFTRIAGANGGGGGGGASSGVASALFFAHHLPDVLRVSVGRGGPGGAANNAGTAGVGSFISAGVGLTAGTTIPNLILQSNINQPGGGGAGATGAAGTAGTVPTITTQASIGHWFYSSIFYKFQVGLVGLAGGNTTVGTAGTVSNQFILNATGPGTGGGGQVGAAQNAGGAITLQAAFDGPDFALTPAANYVPGGVTPGGAGVDGITRYKPFLAFGGTGGGSSNLTAGGRGGKGGIGCGGGGGGAGTTGGTGGDGGDGLVIIATW